MAGRAWNERGGTFEISETFFWKQNMKAVKPVLKKQGKKANQARKGVWWMPWHQSAMKDVDSCEKLRGAAKQALIRRYPNGETRRG